METLNYIPAYRAMRDDVIVIQHRYGGFYKAVRSFTRAKWIAIVEPYQNHLHAHVSCAEHGPAIGAGISRTATSKEMKIYEIGMIVPNV